MSTNKSLKKNNFSFPIKTLRGKIIFGYILFLIVVFSSSYSILIPQVTDILYEDHFQLVSKNSFIMVGQLYREVANSNPKSIDDIYNSIYNHSLGSQSSLAKSTADLEMIGLQDNRDGVFKFYDSEREKWLTDTKELGISGTAFLCSSTPNRITDMKNLDYNIQSNYNYLIYKECLLNMNLPNDDYQSWTNTEVQVITISVPFNTNSTEYTVKLSYIYNETPIEKSAADVSRFFWTAFIVMVALSFILFILLIKFFSTPLEKLSRGVKYIQKGNFNSRLSPINISPEINNLINVINSLLDNINSKIELLEDSNRREMEFISNVAHELKNPITSISMLYEALLTTEKNMTAPQKKILKDIGGRLDHLRNMTSNLLEESHLQKSKDVLQISQFSINKLIKKEIKQLKTLAEEYKTHVIFEPKLKKEIIIESDRERVNSVIRNLLYNAIEFSNSKPVKVELYTREKSVIIKVIDSGPGISEDAKDKIFQRHFTQSMGHSRKYGGSGLGLYISAQNAKMLNGQISLLEPAPKPHGSAFLFTLPLGKK